jgi:hypothetical protein
VAETGRAYGVIALIAIVIVTLAGVLLVGLLSGIAIVCAA